MEGSIARELALEFVRATEAAAVSSSRLEGSGDKKRCDGAAVLAMRNALRTVKMDGTVVIGEGEIDRAPMLYIGESVGAGHGIKLDIAVDPLEGTNILAKSLPSALSVIAATKQGGFLHAPDMYMEKLAVGPLAKGKIDLDYPIQENLRNVALALGKKVEDLTVVILDRIRNKETVEQVRKAGARIKFIADGDLSMAVAVSFPDSGVDVVAGIGGAPEGVLSAAALRCIGGELQARLKPSDKSQVRRLLEMGNASVNKKLTMDDMVKNDDIIFAATGVTDGDILKGVKYDGIYAKTHSLVIRGLTGTVRFIEATHRLDKKQHFLHPEE